MTVKVKLFAILRERARTSEMVLEISEGATVAGAVAALLCQRPELEAWMGKSAFAVNLARVDRQTILKNGDELALLPPVSGG
jgi:molybdopterin synthase sulfur carrier subunit